MLFAEFIVELFGLESGFFGAIETLPIDEVLLDILEGLGAAFESEDLFRLLRGFVARLALGLPLGLLFGASWSRLRLQRLLLLLRVLGICDYRKAY